MSLIDVAPQFKPASVRELRRLGKNLNGYSGETIVISSVIEDCERAAHKFGWNVEKIMASDGVELLTLHRSPAEGASNTKRIYISAGIHGDEPAGPLAIRNLLQADQWPGQAELWICPCLNPSGFVRNRRENAAGTDLNRQYLQPKAEEIIAHIAWLEEQPAFDLCLCLHEDWESNGFYLYELNPDAVPSMTEKIIDRVSSVCPIDHSELIEGRPAKGGIILPSLEELRRLDWPEALFLIMHKTRLSYTFESPSDFPITPRVNALMEATKAAIEGLVDAPAPSS